MEITDHLNDTAVQVELGRRLSKQRLERFWTQAELARQAGLSKRTLERMEAGQPTQLTNLIRVLRALGLLSGLERLIPLPAPSPMKALKAQSKERKRGRSVNRSAQGSKGAWTWGDES